MKRVLALCLAAVMCLALLPIQSDYVRRNPIPEDDFWARVAFYTMAQSVTDEVICSEVIYQ